jgi:hypothetical protein
VRCVGRLPLDEMGTRAGYLLVSWVEELAYNWHRGDVTLMNTGILIVYLKKTVEALNGRHVEYTAWLSLRSEEHVASVRVRIHGPGHTGTEKSLSLANNV